MDKLKPHYKSLERMSSMLRDRLEIENASMAKFNYLSEDEDNLTIALNTLRNSLAANNDSIDIHDVLSKALYRADELFDWEDIEEYKELVKTCFRQIIKERTANKS